jgi:hypothetical protein
MIARASSSNIIEYPTRNHIWLLRAENSGQERIKSFQQLRTEGKPVPLATVPMDALACAFIHAAPSAKDLKLGMAYPWHEARGSNCPRS